MATFEENMKALEDMVGRLERGELPLEDALKAYEEGMGLVRVCQKQLEELSLRVEKVVAEQTGGRQDGEPVATELFEVD